MTDYLDRETVIYISSTIAGFTILRIVHPLSSGDRFLLLAPEAHGTGTSSCTCEFPDHGARQ